MSNEKTLFDLNDKIFQLLKNEVKQKMDKSELALEYNFRILNIEIDSRLLQMQNYIKNINNNKIL